MSTDYNMLVERIVTSSGVEKNEVEKRIEAKRAKLSGLISREGAAQIIAAELGVSFDNVQLKISELTSGMRKINVLAKVLQIFPVRSFEKAGRSGKVANLIIGDETGNTKLVLWDTNHISLIENKQINVGDVVEVKNGATREGEIHLSAFSELKKSSASIENVKTGRTYSEKEIKSVEENKGISFRANVVQVYPPRIFFVCPECGKKVIQDAEGYNCNEHKRVLPKERMLLNIVFDDGTETLRSVLFSDQLDKIVSSETLKDNEKFLAFKEDIMGTEFFVKGVAKKNQLFNTLELNVQDIQKVDPEKLIAILEGK
jgi:replication factor A1